MASSRRQWAAGIGHGIETDSLVSVLGELKAALDESI